MLTKKRLRRRALAVCLAICCAGFIASAVLAQTPPSLAVQFSHGYASLTITGTVGTVYSIQFASDVTAPEGWIDETLVQVKGSTATWTDPTFPAPTQRFYRAVSVCPPADTNLVFIEPGTFTMGSPTSETLRGADETQHQVTISRGFWIGRYLVTQGDYLGVVGNNPSYFTSMNGFSDDLTRPVETVSWLDASNYCALRTQQEQAFGLIPTNYVYRLPTESEWEYADRAGTTTAFYLGSGLFSGQANFNGKYGYEVGVGPIYDPSGIYLATTTAVGSYAPNSWGLYDMIGNVGEWCQDWYGAYPVGSALDPQGPETGSNRTVRGGNWNVYAYYCRSADRSSSDPTASSRYLGFRVVLALAQ